MCNDTHTFVSFFKACPKEYLFFQQELQNLVVSDIKTLTATRLIGYPSSYRVRLIII